MFIICKIKKLTLILQKILILKKQKIYIYNPDTDNFERYFPSIKDRIVKIGIIGGAAVVLGVAVFLITFYGFRPPVEKIIVSNNNDLKKQLSILNQRLNSSLAVMEDISSRDDNFYRVLMQLEPISQTQRTSGLDNENRYNELKKLNDSELVIHLTQQLDLLDRKIMAQSLSFDQLRNTILEQKDKIAHIPSILPLAIEDYTVASGYGMRKHPIDSVMKFHEGLDFSASIGTNVFATADGTVSYASVKNGYGNCIDIDHGYNYLTRYGHLSQILVKNGQEVKRGDLIGKVGSTGKSTGPHLHYEVRFKGKAQNPVDYYLADFKPREYHEMKNAVKNSAKVMD